MRNTFYVMRFEFLSTVFRPAYLVATFGLPLLPILLYAAMSLTQPGVSKSTAEEMIEIVSDLSKGEEEYSATKTDGYVDASGVIQEIPAAIPTDFLKRFPDEESAQRALQNGEISAYYLVPEGYLETGELIYVDTEFNPIWLFTKGKLMKWILQVNLLEGNIQLANQITDPFDLQVTILEPRPDRNINDPMTFMQPYAVMILYYMIMLSSAGLFLSSLKKETENRVIEILLASITPKQLISGKIVGLGAAGLIQTTIWIGIAFAAQRLGSSIYEVPSELQISPAILIWGITFYLLGYLLYASVLAGLGALVPDLRESSQFTMIILIPLLIPTMLMIFFVRDPNGSLPTALSLFPPTSSISMMTRLAASNQVPVWQPLLSCGLIVANIALVMAIVSKLMKAQNLLTGQGFNIKRLFKSLASG